MTKERLNKEIMFDLSLEPYILLHEQGVITDKDLSKIKAYFKVKYDPILVSKTSSKSLDINKNLSNICNDQGGE